MKTVAGWVILTLLAMLTLFEALALYLGQFGFDFVQGGPEPLDSQSGWILLVCKLVGLGLSRRTGMLMAIAGVMDWLFGILFLGMHGQHETLGAAFSNSWFTGTYVVLAVIYVAVTRLWGIGALRASVK